MVFRGRPRGLTLNAMTRIETADDDEVGRLLRRVGDPSVDTAWRLDALLDLARLDDPRIADGLLGVLSDPAEPTSLRLAVLRYLRDQGAVSAGAADVLRHLVRDRASTPVELRIQAGLALGDYTEVPHVVADLGVVCGEASEPFDLRYAAFTALQCAGPTPDCIALLRQLMDDETLGPSARSVLGSWRLA
jgi:hypothetical protein